MTVFAPSLGALWEQLEAYGIDPKPLFEKAGIDPETMFDQGARISVLQYQRLDLKAAELEQKVVEAEAIVAELQALVALAPEAALVALYADYPEYLDYLEALAYAQAWGELDKAIVPVGTQPKAVLSPDGDLTTVVSPE